MPDCCLSNTRQAPAPDRAYRRILIVALALNTAMFFVEVAASLVAGSVSLQADALDFLGDAVNYGVSLAVLRAAVQWRSRAALGKGMVMGFFGLWVAGNTIWHAVSDDVPRADLMGGIGFLALGVNVFVAILLYRYRTGDSNRMSVWLCTRNDAIANVAVILAGGGVWLTSTHWPDIAVAAVIAWLAMMSSIQIVRQAARELSTHDAERANASRC